jgi:Transglycosylase SLT domain
MKKPSLAAQGCLCFGAVVTAQSVVAPAARAQINNPRRSLPPARVARDRTKTPRATTMASAKASDMKKKAAPLPPLPYYDQLRASFKVDPHISLTQVRADASSQAGRVIELKGTISGAMVTPRGRTFIMNVGEDSAILSAAPNLRDGDMLHAGTNVRLLALVGTDADTGEATFTIVAATDKPNLESLFKVIDDDDNAPVELQPLFEMGLPQPPTVPQATAPRPASALLQETALPQPPPARPPAIRAASPGLDSDALEDPVESRKPAFMALARRFNPKLRDDQVDEVATAILTAGFANNMDPRFLAAIIAVESDFDPTCLSSSGAMGLCQLMPFNLPEAGITNAWDITQNIAGGARLLRRHLNDYGNRPDATLLAVAAYNAGPGAVRRAGYKVPPGKQVQRYVWKVYNRYKEFAPDMFR